MAEPESPDTHDRFCRMKSSGDLCELLDISRADLNAALYWRHRTNYRVFEIPKRTGGTRTISAPLGTLRLAQSRLSTLLQEIYQPRPCVHGFRRERSIVSNAHEHVGRRFVLNLDLKDFFPSINFGRVRGMFMAPPYSLPPRVATVLAQICCHENQLPQGAPTSPVVANMICAKMDSELQRLARSEKCSYTRYADDLTFSTTFSPFPSALASSATGWFGPSLAIGDRLRTVINSNGFHINHHKQRLMLHDCHQEVTGLTVNKYPNVKRAYVRQLRGMLHAWDKHGLEQAELEFRHNHDSTHRADKSHPVSFARVVRGKLEFVAMVKGVDDPVYLALRQRLHNLDNTIIDAVPPTEPHPGLDWPDYFRSYRELVYMVEAHMNDGSIDSGTAFVPDQSALATALHNLAQPKKAIIAPPWPEDTPVPTWTPHPDPSIDLALIPLADILPTLRTKFPVRKEPLEEGEPVAAIAWTAIPQRQPALGYHPGVVESLSLDYAGHIETVQVTIQIAGGMSGGPVIDSSGRLVGVMFENTFEKVSEGIPGRQFHHILPVKYLLDIAPHAPS